jgi:NADPH-dependent 2,4-dienoyl-CoA reductase/sulfur reductase-like enzyme/peroxiredoxin family protein/TusA-related sulfurtransferase/rhodanese-related sulfurtransferase
MPGRVLIVGGVAGGASAAARLRRLDEDAEIIIFEKGGHISFANCGLPYYVGETIKDRSALVVQTPERMKAMFNIETRLYHEVTAVNPAQKTIAVKDLINGTTYEMSYDRLILSPGAKPLRPPIPGIDSPGIFTLRTIPDTDAIKEYLSKNTVKSAVIVGGGYIGLEMAENLHALGLNVSVVEKMSQLIGTMDYDMAALVQGHLLAQGVHLYLTDGVTEFRQNNSGLEVILESGKKIDCQMVLLSIGVKPDTAFLAGSGLELGERGGIKVNQYLQTSDPSIYAIGDAALTTDFVSGEQALIPLAGPANKQGRIAANNIAGRTSVYNGTQGTAIAKIFDLAVATTGQNERTLQRRGVNFLSTVTHAKSNADYYPGALPMTIKLHYTSEGLLLGAQIVGYSGVDKAMDTLATALRFKRTVFDLQELELAYAPPFSTAKTPVNVAGLVAGNRLEGTMDVSFWSEIEALNASATILDVGEKEERELGFIAGSVHIPLWQLRDRINELNKDKEIIVYCQIGLRAYLAARLLSQKGFRARVLSGGYRHYKAVKQAEEDLLKQNYRFGDEEMSFRDLTKEDIYSSESNSPAPAGQAGQTVVLNACGLSCPGPVVEVNKKMSQLKSGDVLEVLASDPGFVNDIKAWCAKTGHTLLSTGKEGLFFKARITKGLSAQTALGAAVQLPQNKTIIVFSGDLDKAIASFIIANGAAAMGRKVTMFFTFWGLNILRKPTGKAAKKDFLARMFGMMMPRGSRKLGLSRMNMLGMGPKMIRMVMGMKNVDSLENLIQMAKDNGVVLMACQMSMDVMGIKHEELIEGVEIGGVATYLGEAEDSNVNLFI